MGFSASFRDLTGSLVPFSSAPSCQDAPTHHAVGSADHPQPPLPASCVYMYPSLSQPAEVLGLCYHPTAHAHKCSNPEIHINLIYFETADNGYSHGYRTLVLLVERLVLFNRTDAMY